MTPKFVQTNNPSTNTETGTAPPALSRRAFLQGAGLLLAGGLLAACGTPSEPGWQAGDYYQTATAASHLASPMPAGAPTADATPAPEGLELFLALSGLLTGFDNLDPELGQVYLRSLQQNPEFGGLEALYEQAGLRSEAPPDNLEELEQAGVFADEATRNLADQIIRLWYTGIYTDGEEPHVATFVDSLAWKSITFTKPLTICGSFGFWAERPQGVY